MMYLKHIPVLLQYKRLVAKVYKVSKKAFTLAEILIVLMVIGVIATMTIPSMMRGVQEAQLKAGYKKAYNTIVNLVASEYIAGELPVSPTQRNANHLMYAIDNVSNTNFYIHQILDAGVEARRNRYYSCAELDFGSGKGVIGIKKEGSSCIDSIYLPQLSELDNGATVGTPIWIVPEDNAAYTVLVGRGASCSTKEVIQAQTTLADVIRKSCFVIVVDVNGLSKGPNRIEPQTKKMLDANERVQTITGDRFQIYVGKNGATAGSPQSTLTGRLVRDLK